MLHDQETKSLVARTGRGVDGMRPSFVVTILAGPDRGLAFELDGAQASRSLVGTGPSCAIRVTDPLVSRRHAAFDVETEGLRVQDLGSKNGTVVNGLRVNDALLGGGEVVRVGTTMLKVSRVADVAVARSTSAMAFGRVVGASAEMRRLYPLCKNIADASVPALIEGESGTGKELLAEALHENGPRAMGPFVVFDCADPGMPLAAAVESARDGTILLDEVEALDAAMQRDLLAILEHGSPARVLAATRGDLEAEVQEGRFREELLRRLLLLRVELPPLRKRKDDVALLARHFWRRLGGGDAMPADLVARVETYAWPGNVRELANFVARRFARGTAEPLDGGDAFDDAIEQVLELPFPRARAAAIAEFEKRYVARVLARHGGHVGRAAAASGIARRYFQMIRVRAQR